MSNGYRIKISMYTHLEDVHPCGGFIETYRTATQAKAWVAAINANSANTLTRAVYLGLDKKNR